MGVHGLWKLVEPSGKIVPLDTLENKVLAVDVSIWLHQVVKGFQDSRGQALPNSHLLGLFHRICKLLYYRIQPVFVFDGSVPQLKKQTLVARRQQKSKAEESAEKTREKLLRNLVKHKALRRVLGQKGAPLDLGGPTRQPEDMFQLPPPQDTASLAGTSSSEDEDEEEDAIDRPKVTDLHSVNVKSTEFLSLPADLRHDILTELKETRKQSSWGRLHQMPKESSDFSSYQMSRLLKRRSVQVSLEAAEKEMGGRTLSLGELGELLADQGVAVASDVSKRIASDNITRFVYVTESPKSSPEKFKSGETSREPSDVNCSPVKKIRLEETVQEPLTTKVLLEEDRESSLLLDSKLQVARDFMLENSGLTQGQILSVIKHQSILGRDTSPCDSLNTLESAGPSTSAFGALSGALCDIDSDSDRMNADNQGLTQEQILALIHSQQDGNTITVDSSGQGDSMVANEETIDSNELGDHSKEENICVSESTDLNITVKHKVTADVSVTNKYLTVKNSPVVSKMSFSKHSSDTVKQEGSSTMEIIESSTSDSDDFIDVSEPVSKDKALNTTMNVPANTLAVTIQSTIDNKTLDSDIFADVFSDIDIYNLENIVKKVGVTGVVPRDETLHKDHSLVVKVLEDLSRGVTDDKSRNTSPITGSLQNVDASIEELVGNEVIDHSEEERAHRSSGDSEEEESKPATPKLTMEELQVLQSSLEQQHRSLLAEKGRQERLAASITDQMYLEAQELLQLFGVPYIVAPMEAEAQCAYLDSVSLTEGTITDDSDIWLFGGTKVYKNFFDQKKKVLQFKAEDIHHYFKLGRDQMVLLALLVGSDYTMGLRGVGPVTALEILAAFPPVDSGDLLAGLQMFRDWLKGGKMVATQATQLRHKLRNVSLNDGFPSKAVVEAYLKPHVDESQESFSWGSPNLESLRDYARSKFGWTPSKTDEILLPVLKRHNEAKSQRSIASYFKATSVLQVADGQLSKRVQQAVRRLGNEEVTTETQAPEMKKLRNATKKDGGHGTSSASRAHSNVNPAIVQSAKRGVATVSTLSSAATHSRTQSTDGPTVPRPVIAERIPPIKLPTGDEFILQREREKLGMLKNKMKAIEVFRKSRTGLDKTKRDKRKRRQILEKAHLSESSSGDD